MFFDSHRGANKRLTATISTKEPPLKEILVGNVICKGKEAADVLKNDLEKVYKNADVNKKNLKVWTNTKGVRRVICDELEVDFTEDEISIALDNTPNNTPGISGITTEVLRKLNGEYVKILTEFANNFLKVEGYKPDVLTNALITMIPKTNDKIPTVDNLRPISLIEIPKKVITRAMTNRLVKWVVQKKIIHPAQMCHPGRNIRDNIFLIQSFMESWKDYSYSYAISFVDIRKAFDTVNWDYLLGVLEDYGFQKNFRNFVKNIIDHSAQVVFDGFLSDSFKKREVYLKEKFLLHYFLL